MDSPLQNSQISATNKFTGGIQTLGTHQLRALKCAACFDQYSVCVLCNFVS